MDREAWDSYLEKGILGLVLSILISGPLCFGAVSPFPFSCLQWLTAAALLLWAARCWINPKTRLLFPPLCWAVLAFMAYALFRYFTADIEYIARNECGRVLTYGALFFLVLNNLHGQENTRLITAVMVVLAMGVAAFAVYQYAANTSRIWYLTSPYTQRGLGTYINPNHLAGFLELVFPLGVTHALLARSKALPRVLFGYAALVILAGIVVSLSRGGWLSTLVAIGALSLVLLNYRAYRWPLLITLALILGGGGLFIKNSLATQLRFRQIFSTEKKDKVDDSLRFTLWKPAFEMWRDHPWTGVGPGHFNTFFRLYRPPLVQMQPDRAHNDYLNTLTDYGVIGFAIIACGLALLGRGVARTWPFVRGSFSELGERKGSNKFAVVLGVSLGLLAILVHSLVDFNMHIPANAIIVAVWMAILAGHIRFATERYWHSMRAPSRSLFTVMILVLVLGLGWQGTLRVREQFWREKARTAELYSSEQIRYLKKAHAIDPRNARTTYDLGEALRIRGQEGRASDEQVTREAMSWFKLGMSLNPWDGYNQLRYAMCLAWLGRYSEALPWLNRAEMLDPHGYFMLAQIGLCYLQMEKPAAARPWLLRSLKLKWDDNDIARQYLSICENQLLREASLPLRLRAAAAILPQGQGKP